jgi:hypothetical protein
MATARTDRTIDALYAAPPGEFVKRRDALAKALREQGDREAAEQVKALRKPTVAARAVNQLAQKEKMRLRGLFTAGERLRAAHEDALAGGVTPALAEARDDERAAIEELARAARALLEEQGHPASDAVLDKVRDTLHAAVVDEELGERVRAGRLEKEEQATGFGFALAAGTPPAKPRRNTTAQKRKAEQARTRKRREAQERLRAARLEAEAARKAAEQAAKNLERAERALEESLAALEKAQRDVEANGPR